MRKSLVLMSFLAILPNIAWAYGEGGDIPSDARAIHLLINESRTDTKAALADCGSNCLPSESYQEVLQPLYWEDGLYRAAQFHANMQSYLGGMCLTHDSPCTLKDSVASDFPDVCDGNPACACKEGSAQCGNVGTATFERVRMFYSAFGMMAENIAWSGYSPIDVHFQFLHEDGKQTYGHRANILSKDLNAVGIGRHTNWTSQDFAGQTNVKSAISAGAHYYSRDKSQLWFKTHYYADTAVALAKVSLNGRCLELTKTLGSNQHGVWGIAVDAPEKCTSYFYEVKDADGTLTRFPSTGSLLFDCEQSWKADASVSCFVETPTDKPTDPTPEQPTDPTPEQPTNPTPEQPETPSEPDLDDEESSGGNSENGNNSSDQDLNAGDSSVEDSSCSANPYRFSGNFSALGLMFALIGLCGIRRRKFQNS